MFIHIPHASTKIDGLVEFKSKEKENLDFLTDTNIDLLYDRYHCITFPYSRFVCDVERLVNDPLEKDGHGIIYRKDAFGNDLIRHISDEKTMNLYNKHHRKLTKLVNHRLAYLFKAVIVDAHSFTDDTTKVDVCVGTDDFHTPNELIDIVVDHFCKYGYNVSINEPYLGTIIPKLHEDNENVYSIMIELNKRIYINRIDEARLMIQSLMDKIKDYEWSFG